MRENLHYEDDNCIADLEIHELKSALDNVRYGMLESEAIHGEYDDPALRTMAIVLWPAAISASTGTIQILDEDSGQLQQIAWPPTPAVFADLPNDLVNGWLELVYRLNPERDPTRPRQEKKALSGSPQE